MTGLPDKLTETPDRMRTGPRWTFSTTSWLASPDRRSGRSTANSAAISACCAQFTPDHFAPFFPLPETLISYHYVRSGRMIVEVDGHAAGDARGGRASPSCRATTRICSPAGPGLPPADVERDQLGHRRRGPPRVRPAPTAPRPKSGAASSAPPRAARIRCSTRLPPLLTLDVAGGEAEWLDSSMRFLAEQQPSPEIVARLAELFLAQAVREYVERLPAGVERLAARAGRSGGVARRCRSSTSAMPRSSTSKDWRARRACRARCSASGSPS